MPNYNFPSSRIPEEGHNMNRYAPQKKSVEIDWVTVIIFAFIAILPHIYRWIRDGKIQKGDYQIIPVTKETIMIREDFIHPPVQKRGARITL